ncbi:ATP-dependent DNA helicase [Candidatus Micrarchaeota archaeon]|nr:ATP-dependent DNA helicase [Candidatus Micrarchaeota archaeon]
MDDIYSAISTHNNILINAPTGLGKTDAALTAAISHSIENDSTIFFLTPKISQHKIALDVVNGIAAKHNLKIRGVDLVGRSHCCIDTNLIELDGESFHQSCTKKRRDEHCNYYGNARGYSKIEEARAESRFKVVVEQYGSGKSHHELISMGAKSQCCPYEWLLKLSEISNVVIADYYHLMIPSIRDVFLMKIKKRLENSIIIIDEAHNLAARVRDSLSSSIGSGTFRRMEKEMHYLQMESGPIEEEFAKWASRLLGKEERMLLLEKDLDVFFDQFGFTVDEITEKLEEVGTTFIEKTNKKSASLKIANFLMGWKNKKDESIRVLKRKGEFYYISKRLLDPSPATQILNSSQSAVLMSGTLLPLEMHKDILGLDPARTMLKTYPSPFNPDHVSNIICDKITTRYSKRDEDEYRKMAQKIDGIVKVTPGGVAVFFCSYKVMESVLRYVQSSDLVIQQAEQKPHEIRKMLRDFKQNSGVLCAVQGGSLAEGVDFSEGEIKSCIIVGVALEELDLETRSLIEYYDEKFGKGWDYGYLYPALMRALQAAGRGRRKESDRLAIVYLDERFKWNKYNWILNKKERIIISENPEEEVKRFWANERTRS